MRTPTSAPHTTASLARIGRVISGLAEAIAAASNRLDRRPSERPVDLFAQVPDIHVDHVRVPVVPEVPHVLDDPGAAHDLPRPSHEELEQREFLCREADLDIVP